MPGIDRRGFLHAGLAAGSLIALPGTAWPQSSLLSLPKIALILGNSKYKEAPLKNPANDAAAIGEALKATGFAVTTKLDAGKVEMAAAVQAYVAELAKRKGVGLFYYAGHGIQLAWRNYMLPVDADIDTIADIQKQGVEVNALLEGITKASNPMNIVILDACRDNPFGNLKGVDHKGLSQMDAPTHTLLAYATSPGNVASDGDGANGLYTENLLRELKVPDAKVEDVFKRVRLGVRVKSKGAQIPWESTSLEEDFWFLPPASVRRASEQEKARAFKEELALWERIKEAKEPGPYEDYLRRYPSGEFCEYAQLHLERVLARQGEKKIVIASQEGNPFTKGSAVANTSFKVGDSYTFRELDPYSKVEQKIFTRTIAQVSENEVVFDDGLVQDLLGNNLRQPDGRRLTPNQAQPLEYAVGKRWHNRFIVTFPDGLTNMIETEGHIPTRERVTVPAGTFDAFRMEIRGQINTPKGVLALQVTAWRAPDTVRMPIAREERRRAPAREVFAERRELVSFKQG